MSDKEQCCINKTALRVIYYIIMSILGLYLALAIAMLTVMNPHRDEVEGAMMLPIVVNQPSQDVEMLVRMWLKKHSGEGAVELPIDRRPEHYGCQNPGNEGYKKFRKYWHIHFRMATFLGFADDFGVKFTEFEVGRTCVEIQSQSRMGKFDFGKNATRIQKFLNFMITKYRHYGIEEMTDEDIRKYNEYMEG